MGLMDKIEVRALYTGPTYIAMLEHGQHYMLRKRTFKNGHVMVDVLDVPGYSIRYTSIKAYGREWKE